MTVTNASITEVRIVDITVGRRRRDKLGKLESLQRSIRLHGLIHPILLRNGNQLVAGGRRLEACRRLDWITIPARHVDDLSDEELREIELTENVEREALSDYAASKARLAEIRQAEARAKAEASEGEAATKTALSVGTVNEKRRHDKKTGKKPSGRPKQSGSKRDIARETGIDPKTQARTERHVDLAEQFPFMQRPGWVQHSVLEAGVSFDKMSPADRQAAAALLDQDAIPPKTAIAMLENLAEMPATERKQVFRHAKSNDEVDRQTALTMAAKLPPPPDPGLTLLGDADSKITRAAKECREVSFKSKLSKLASQVHDLYKEFFDHMKEKRNNG